MAMARFILPDRRLGTVYKERRVELRWWRINITLRPVLLSRIISHLGTKLPQVHPLTAVLRHQLGYPGNASVVCYGVSISATYGVRGETGLFSDDFTLLYCIDDIDIGNDAYNIKRDPTHK